MCFVTKLIVENILSPRFNWFVLCFPCTIFCRL